MTKCINNSSTWRKAAVALCSVALLLSPLASQAQRVSLDKVIAIVDEDVILQSDLDSRVAELAENARLNNRPIPPAEQMRQEVLDLLVIESVQLQLAERASIRFDDDTLNRILENLARQSNMTFDQYVNTLQQAGVYRQTREQVRRELTLQELQRGMVNRRINITDQEIENFLNSEMGRTAMAADYLVDHILVAIDEDDSNSLAEEKLQYAANLVNTIQSGADFAQTRASAQQERRFPVSGTNFGWRRLQQIPSLFTDIVPELEVGEIAGPIRAGNGFHIIKLADMRGGTERLVNQTHFRHIMISPNEIRTEEQALALVTRLRERIVEGEDFETLARQNSEDASSVVAGGDLDWVNEGGMPPEMEATVNGLQIGELSEPFRTESGWHIAEVLGRREQDMSLQYSRSQAENALRNRKYDLELENWLLELRESAFVEFKD
jgi:peptidyl-prolyl cis-trans isomerase SurA